MTDVVVSWLVKVSVALVLLGVVGYDGISIIASHAGAQDDANTAAEAAAASWQQSHDLTVATQQAESKLTETETLVPRSLQIAANGSVTLKMKRTVNTILAGHLPGISGTTSFVTGASASAPTP